jgi:hypothetical protein
MSLNTYNRRFTDEEGKENGFRTWWRGGHKEDYQIGWFTCGMPAQGVPLFKGLEHGR